MIHQFKLFIIAMYDAVAIVSGTVVYHGLLVIVMTAGLCIALSAIPVIHGQQDPHAEEIGALKQGQLDQEHRLSQMDRRLAVVETTGIQNHDDLSVIKDTLSRLLNSILAVITAAGLKALHWLYVALRRKGSLPDRRLHT